MLKQCKRCAAQKPLSEFRRDPRYKDGFGSWCKNCHRERNSEWARENRPRLTAKPRDWRKQNEDTWRDTYRRFHERNKEQRASAHSEWAKNNKGLRRASGARHKAAKLQATPAWVDHEAIKAVYKEAVRIQQHTGIRMHVDHIVPLQHDLVCGLHVPWNLQIIPGALNESKRNKWPCSIEDAYKQPDMFVEPIAKPVQLSLTEAAE